ncbi:uncharacterized protein DUF58 [Pontibacter ummariensis]|uniref:DUF58 domain-containing protein n=1 Tax=Pontibacter ummariensis TaxID=1610492 RepID=A0A239C5M8_9BACT|nr:DUF58 domain-containing protein [Pontibacter ummariensis]PRY15454.1 uncharacterized protein DUF58 [Pontibacter ummariensis]SNS14978.1 Protein of unknown function DUF58 [Pontibacter ummariensis]
MKELVKKLRKYEIRIRKAITTQMQGDFHSVFKGTGLEFDDVRAYQYGDDVRSIDWNVSAKGHGTFVKTYREEKEQSVFLMLDVSGSQNIGTGDQQKLDVGKEICGVLALSAARQQSQIGMICISEQKEKYIQPAKGIQQAYAIIKALNELEPKSTRTNLAAGIKLTLDIIKRRSIILLLSDFIDVNYEKELAMLAKRHDLIVLHLQDLREHTLPSMGIVPVLDKETGRTIWLNTSGQEFKKRYLSQYQENKEQLMRLCQKYQANYLAIQTNEDYVPQLVNLFRLRNKSTKKSA